MEAIKKIDVFIDEIQLIEDREIKEYVKNIIQLVPDYFFEIPASSTGKYHPEYCLGVGGLVRHTKAAVKISVELFNLEMFSSLLIDRDLIIAALILHDCLKKGYLEEKYTRYDHPKLAFEFIKKNNFNKLEISKNIARLVLSHMGQWNTDKNGKEILPKPCYQAEKFVHLCDYLASRKSIEVKLKINNMERKRSTKTETKNRKELLHKLGISLNTYYNYKYGRSKIPVLLYPYLKELNLKLK